MKISDLFESKSLFELRRNPEQNPRVSTLEALKKYAGRKDVFVSFTSDVGERSHGNNGKNTSGSKLGINPKSIYNTPIGIYTYPIDYVISRKGRVPFAAEQPYIYVVQSTKSLLDLSNYSKYDFKRDSKKLIDMGFADTRDEGIRTAASIHPAAHIWNWTRLAASEKAAQWTKILRSLGYSGAIDLGSGLIHGNENTQAVFFSMDAVKVLEVIPNTWPERLRTAVDAAVTKNVKLAAVTQDGYAIKYIKNPSEKVQLAAVTQNGAAIQFIRNPSEAIQLAAVRSSPFAIQHIKNPSEEMKYIAVRSVGDAIQYIKNPSEELQIESLTKSGWIIRYINNPSEAVQLAAIAKSALAIQHIKNPSEKAQLAAVTKNKSVIEYIANPTEAVKKAAGF